MLTIETLSKSSESCQYCVPHVFCIHPTQTVMLELAVQGRTPCEVSKQSVGRHARCEKMCLRKNPDLLQLAESTCVRMYFLHTWPHVV